LKKIHKVYPWRKTGMLYFSIPALAISLLLIIGAYITNTIANDFSRRLARQYSIEAAANFLNATNSHFVLAQQLAYSTTISRWMAHGYNQDIRARAIEEIIGYAHNAPYIFLMFSSYKSLDVYDLRLGFTEEDFTPWWQIEAGRDLWFFNTKYSKLPFNLNIQRSRPVDGHWEVYVWTNHRMYYQGNFTGVVTAGSPFRYVFDAVFGDYDIENRRGYIIDYNGLARVDSAELLKILDDGLSHPAIIPETADNPILSDRINVHIATVNGGAFNIGRQVCEAIPLQGKFRYASIAPIIGTNWSVVVLSSHTGIFDIVFLPMVISVFAVLVIAVLVGNIIINKSLEGVEEANRAKSSFLARMSHEIRTPLSAVLGISEIELRNSYMPPHTEKAFTKIYHSAKTLLHLVNDILDFSKVESGKMSLLVKEYEVESLISDVAQLHLIYTEQKDIDFKLHIDANIPLKLKGDILRLRQIITNLLTNAFKYTETGTVSMSLSCEAESEGRVILVINVEDTGIGMSAKQIKALKSDYVRFHESVKPYIGGTGLGIPIVYSLAYLMNGQFEITSEVGKGTKTVVSIPQEVSGQAILGQDLADRMQNFDSEALTPIKDIEFMQEPLRHGKVLVVDDVDTNLYVAEAMLESFGLDVDLAESGQEAIDKITDGTVYDIIFLDHMMPGMDGIEVIKNLHNIGYNRPIIALTANAIKGQEEIFMENGFAGFMTKPIDIEILNSYLMRFVKNAVPYD